ncbi:MAG TPA: alpha/beta hydrolase-fold protein [Acidobacteriota bacterium]|nr:alpha/beta hydrolase-fold protein [Acidobacteriota bacterium]
MKLTVSNVLNQRFSIIGMLILVFLVPLAGLVPTAAQTPASGGSMVKKHAQFSSKLIDPRDVDVWLPPGYETDTHKRYPVLYMHDGQNIFDPKTSYGGVDWGVDETMDRLIREKKIRPAIVVGIWNSPKRYAEYMPQKAAKDPDTAHLKNIPINATGPIVSDKYLKFLVTELKPFIDAHYRTLTDRKNTSIMGSSMGGLISAYAISEYPNVFGGAGCVSTHWPAGEGSMIEYLKNHLPDPRTHKIYFDYGTATLDSTYEPFQLKMDEVMKQHRYKAGKNWITRKFEGAEHSEKSWRERVDIPLVFLIGK